MQLFFILLNLKAEPDMALYIDEQKKTTTKNKRPMGHNSLTWVKPPLQICRRHATFSNTVKINIETYDKAMA